MIGSPAKKCHCSHKHNTGSSSGIEWFERNWSTFLRGLGSKCGPLEKEGKASWELGSPMESLGTPSEVRGCEEGVPDKSSAIRRESNQGSSEVLLFPVTPWKFEGAPGQGISGINQSY